MATVWRQHEDRIVERLGGEENRVRLLELLDRILVAADDGSSPA